MYARERDYKPLRKSVIRMDPDCAICHAPATLACDCEAKGLDMAIRQAEQRMMQSVYNDIRSWVRAHAQDYILEYFRLLTERRKQAHTTHLDRITAHAYHYYHAPPHPNEIAAAQAQLKRGIDEDWQASVQRYPEVLEYFYSLVELTLPSDDEPNVKDPPLSALSGQRKASRRSATAAPALGGLGSVPPGGGGGSVHLEPPVPLAPRGRTPPAVVLESRRTPLPPSRNEHRRTYTTRSSHPPPPPPTSYFQHGAGPY